MEGNLVYLVAAYGVFWAGTLGLVAAMWRRQRSIASELDRLEGRLRRIGGSADEPPRGDL
ncbi:MAG: CcmD family protein [Chloroflexi bacterium]|nr:CcmD family protein [Chloroflexota bacterium]